MKTATIDAAGLARLADAGQEFGVSAQAQDDGGMICVHDQRGDRALLESGHGDARLVAELPLTALRMLKN